MHRMPWADTTQNGPAKTLNNRSGRVLMKAHSIVPGWSSICMSPAGRQCSNWANAASAKESRGCHVAVISSHAHHLSHEMFSMKRMQKSCAMSRVCAMNGDSYQDFQKRLHLMIGDAAGCSGHSMYVLLQGLGSQDSGPGTVCHK